MSQQPHGLSRYETLVKFCTDSPPKPMPNTFSRLGERSGLTGIAPDGRPFATKAILDVFDDVVTGMSDKTAPTTHDVAAGMTFFA